MFLLSSPSVRLYLVEIYCAIRLPKIIPVAADQWFERLLGDRKVVSINPARTMAASKEVKLVGILDLT